MTEININNQKIHVEEIDRLRAENEKLRQGISEYNFELEALKKENERFKDNSLAGCIPLLQSYEDSLQACHDEIHRLKDLVNRAKPFIFEKYLHSQGRNCLTGSRFSGNIETDQWLKDSEEKAGNENN